MMAPDCRGHQYMMRLSNVGISFKRGLKRGLNESPQKRGTPCIKAFPCIRPCPFGRDEATRTPDPYVPNVVRDQRRYIPIARKRLQRYGNFLKYVQVFEKKIAQMANLS